MPFPHPPVSHEPRIAALGESLAKDGLHPFHLPLGILLDEKDGKATPTSICIRCDAFDGFPCLLNGKADAQVVCVDPALRAHPNLTLLTGAYVSRLETDGSGRAVTGVHVVRNGEEERYSADIVVVACGALSSALLLLRSGSDSHPNGLANGSGQVGRNYMRHNQSILMALMREPNDTVFQKTLAVSDYYFGSDDWEYPLGLIQMCAKSHGAQIRGEAVPGWLEWVPKMPFEEMARHSMDFWLSSEDLPRPENRIFYDQRPGMPRHHAGQHGSPPSSEEEARGDAEPGRRASGVAGAEPVFRQEHSDRRHRAPGRNRAVRRGSRDLRARSRLQGPPARQPLSRRCELLSLDRIGQSNPDHHRQCAARGRQDCRAPLIPDFILSGAIMDYLQTQGIRLPRLGLGTYRMQGDVCRAAVESALGLGYRHIDTAEMYGNEDAIGAAIAASRVARQDLHVTTKVWNENLAPDAIRRAFDASLKKLRLDHVDLYLVHWPAKHMDLPAMFETLVRLKEEGRTRAIGVANFNIALLRTVVEEIRAPIACNQIEYHVMLDQTPIRKYLKAKSIPLVAYCPLAQGRAASNQALIADRQEARRHRRPGGAEMAARSG